MQGRFTFDELIQSDLTLEALTGHFRSIVPASRLPHYLLCIQAYRFYLCVKDYSVHRLVRSGPISQFQDVKHKLAMAETTLLAHQALLVNDQAISICNTHVRYILSEALEQCLFVLGASGFMKATRATHYWLDCDGLMKGLLKEDVNVR